MAESGKIPMKTRGDRGQRRRLARDGEPRDEGTRVRGRAGLARGEQGASALLPLTCGLHAIRGALAT